MEALIDDNRLKNLFKQAIIEAMEEKKDVVQDLFMEVMEDIALIRAIEEGETSGNATRSEVFKNFRCRGCSNGKLMNQDRDVNLNHICLALPPLIV